MAGKPCFEGWSSAGAGWRRGPGLVSRLSSGRLHVGAAGAVEAAGHPLAAFGIDLAGLNQIPAGYGVVDLASEFGAGLFKGHGGPDRGAQQAWGEGDAEA